MTLREHNKPVPTVDYLLKNQMENEKVLRWSVGGSTAINQAMLCLPSVYFDPRRDFSSDKTFSKTQKKENH